MMMMIMMVIMILVIIVMLEALSVGITDGSREVPGDR